MLRGAAAWKLALLLLVGVFAGCTDNPLPEATNAEAGAVPGVTTSTGILASMAAYAGPEHVMFDRWENGTYAVTDSAWPLGGPINLALQDRRAERTFDLAPDLPKGVPVLLVLEADATTRGGDWPQGGDIELGVRANAMDFVAGDWEPSYGGHSEARVVLQAISGEPIDVVLFYDEVDPSPEISYTVHMHVMGSADIVLPGAVAGLMLEPGDLLVLEPMGGTPEVAVFDGADNYVDRYDVPNRTEIRIPKTAVGGEFVLMNKQDGGAVRVLAMRNDTSPLRPIGFEWIAGVEKPLNTPTVTWEEDVKGRLVATGLWIHGTDQPYRCGSTEATMTGPGGDELIVLGYADATCLGGGPVGFGLWGQTRNAPSAVRDGTYTMEVKVQDSLNLMGQAWYLTYKR